MAVMLVAVLAVGNILVVRSLLQESDGLAVAVNVAGKMRMLSQRITLEVLAGAAAPHRAGQSGQYRAAFDQAYRALTSGGEVFGMDVQRIGAAQMLQLAAVGRDWQTYQGLAFSAGSADRPDVISDPVPLLAAGDQLLASAEALLDALVKHARDVQQSALYHSSNT